MKDYYRTVFELNRLNDMLLQLFQEAILYADDPGEPVVINKRFQARKGFIEARHERVFERYPFALLEIFLLLAQHQELKGVRASTIRLIRDHRHIIDDDFRNDLRARSIFMEIIRQPRGVWHELARMNRYGILAAYLPAFGRIVGQMQYDLFHVYTVDVHSLFVVRNLRRFAVAEYAHEFPLHSELYAAIPKPELLLLAALFHDIAKGRGGDHSELGAADAIAFCMHHDLSQHDTQLVAWLVQNHLLMSTTAQRRDISDPAVINDFARHMQTTARLNYLYLLTVADIRATSPELWNSWKSALLLELYKATRTALRRGLDNPFMQDEFIEATRTEARQLLRDAGVADTDIEAIWGNLDDDYFLRHSPQDIAWHTRCIIGHTDQNIPLVELRHSDARGGTELFIYTRADDTMFERTTALLDQLGLDIHDARITTARDGHALDTYLILDESGTPIQGAFQTQEIIATLTKALSTLEHSASKCHPPSATPLPAFQHPDQNQLRRRHTQPPHRDGIDHPRPARPALRRRPRLHNLWCAPAKRAHRHLRLARRRCVLHHRHRQPTVAATRARRPPRAPARQSQRHRHTTVKQPCAASI